MRSVRSDPILSSLLDEEGIGGGLTIGILVYSDILSRMTKKKSVKKNKTLKTKKTQRLSALPSPIPSNHYPSRVKRTHVIADAVSVFGKSVTVAGRVVALYEDGFVLRDESGEVYVRAPEVPALWSIVEVSGGMEKHLIEKKQGVHLRASRGRELSFIEAEPTRNTQWERMLLNPEERDIVYKRAEALATVRQFFTKKGFLEVDTPSLVSVPGAEPYLSPLETVVECADGARADAYFVTSPEYSLKKLLAAGFEKIFEFSRSFRNCEELGGLHNPEFLMLEWYRAYASYENIMDDCEGLFLFVAKSLLKSTTLRARGSILKLEGKWERLSVVDAFQKYAAIDLEKNLDEESLRLTLRAKGYRPTDKESYDDLFFRVFLNEIEPCLGRKVPTLLYDYPVQMAAMAKKSEKDLRFAERFELYVAGLELANGYTELNDPKEQEKRLHDDLRLRKKLGKTAVGPDMDFLHALRTGMPPSGGVALGLDRMIMLFLGKEKIEDVRLFSAKELFVFTKKAKLKYT